MARRTIAAKLAQERGGAKSGAPARGSAPVAPRAPVHTATVSVVPASSPLPGQPGSAQAAQSIPRAPQQSASKLAGPQSAAVAAVGAATVAGNAPLRVQVPLPEAGVGTTKEQAQHRAGEPEAPRTFAEAPPAQAAPKPQTGGDARSSVERPGSAVAALLKLEAEMRRARSLAELSYFIANEPRSVVRAQQIVVFERKTEDRMSVCAVSSVTRIDRSSPLVLWFEQVVATLDRDHGLKGAREFEAGAFSTAFDDVRDAYPLRNLVWIPFLDFDGQPIAGMLMARTIPWTEADITVASHLASSFAHSWMALDKARSRLRLPGRISSRKAAAIGLGLAVLSLFPVSMSALAPVEVAPRDSFVVTTGVEGVVDQVLVEPNAPVKKGQVLVQLADTVLKNKYEIASREVVVAETKYKKAAQLAFVDMRGRHEMALAKAELELRTAERDYARDLLFRATVKADRDGIAFFGDKKDLIGRPVAVGEKLMEIADAATSEFHVDLGVADAIVLHDQARVKVFLDSDPLHPIEAKLARADYQARAHDGQNLAFRIIAEQTEQQPKPLRLGVRGTAQVYSDRVPLVYYILRRPIAAARQWIGL